MRVVLAIPNRRTMSDYTFPTRNISVRQSNTHLFPDDVIIIQMDKLEVTKNISQRSSPIHLHCLMFFSNRDAISRPKKLSFDFYTILKWSLDCCPSHPQGESRPQPSPSSGMVGACDVHHWRFPNLPLFPTKAARCRKVLWPSLFQHGHMAGGVHPNSYIPRADLESHLKRPSVVVPIFAVKGL